MIGKHRVGLLAFCGLAFAAFSTPALADAADSAVGSWSTDSGSVIRLAKSGDRLIGTIVSVADNSRRDSHNPDPSLQSRKLPGIRILSLQKASASSWQGSLYNTEDGKTYSGTIDVVSAGKLKLQGCVFGFLCKTRYWTRR